MSRRRRRPAARLRRSPSFDSDDGRGSNRHADYRKDRRPHSPPPRRRRPSLSISPKRGNKDRLSPVPTSPGRSPSPVQHHERKRRRSMERYAPAARRRRNTSSVSSPDEKKRKIADPEREAETRLSSPEETSPKAAATRSGEKAEEEEEVGSQRSFKSPKH